MKSSVAFYKRIGFKILLGVFVAVALSLMINSIIATNVAKQELIDAKVETITDVAVEKASALEQYVANNKAVAEAIKNNQELIDVAREAKKTGKMDAAQQKAFADYLGGIAASMDNIYENLFITIGSAGFADCLNNATLHDVAEENFYKECQAKGHYYGNNISPVTGSPVYVIAYAITDPATGEMLGSVNASIAMSNMGKGIVQSSSMVVTVLDFEGNIIATNDRPDENILKVNIKEQDPKAFEGILASKTGYNKVDLRKFGGKLSYLGYCVTGNFITEVAADYDDIVKEADAMATQLIALSVVMVILSLLVVFVIVMLNIRPLQRAAGDIQSITADIKAGHGDLTKKLTSRHKDEVGLMVESVNDLTATMADIISNVQCTTYNVTTSSGEISDSVEHAESNVAHVSSTMEDMSAASEETSASISQIMTQVSSVNEMIESFNEQSNKQAKFAGEVVKKVNAIRANADIERVKANEALKTVTDNLRAKIENAKTVQEIGNLTDEIISISAQTNLLSLNASIEAARAGEAGRGFAVVADEIRALADSSKEAANRIQDVTKGVIQAVEDLAHNAAEVTEFMLTSNEEGHAHEDELTANYSSDIQVLSDAMVAFNTSSGEIQDSMEVIKSAIEAVDTAAEENARGITNVAELTISISAELQDIVSKTAGNTAETNALAETINVFKVK